MLDGYNEPSSYSFEIWAPRFDENSLLLARYFLPLFVAEEEGFCLAHFINDRVVVSESIAMVEFTGIGDFETFQCNLDREGFNPGKID